MSFESTVKSLLGGIQFDDPRLYSLLDLLVQDFYALQNQVNPPTGRTFGATGQGSTVDPVTNLVATISSNNVRLTWTPASGISFYEVRFKNSASTDWDTATSIATTSTNSIDINPLTIPMVYGTYTFLVRAINSLGIQSDTVSVQVVISTIPAPSLTVQVIDNFALLRWTEPASQFEISYYNIYRDGSNRGLVDGTFTTLFETASGTYTYEVEPVDIVGNVGSRGSFIAVINQPPDYELQDSRISALGGTKVSCVLEGTALLACVNITETIQEHFVNNSWDGP